MMTHSSRSLKFFIPLLLLCAAAALGEVDTTTAYPIDEEITRHIQEIIKLRRFLPDEKSIAVGIKAASHLLLDGLAYQHRIED